MLYDFRGTGGPTGFSSTVFLANVFLLPPTLEEFLALPREVFDAPEEMAAAGIRTIDMGGGAKNYYKEKMKSYDSFVAQGVVTSRSILGGAHQARNGLTWMARRTVRQHPGLHFAAGQILRRSGLAHRIWGRI